MAERRLIDKTGYRALKTAIEKPEEGDNDPFIMGDIAEKIEEILLEERTKPSIDRFTFGRYNQ